MKAGEAGRLKEVSIRLRPLPSSDWLTHSPAFGTSTIDLTNEVAKHASPLIVIGVRLNGVPLRQCPGDKANTVTVSPPISLCGHFLEVLCLTAAEPAEARLAPLEALKPFRATHPSPLDGYGLQAPLARPERQPQ